MAELKTKVTTASVAKFIAGIKDPRQRRDAEVLMKLMKGVTRKEPKMWGSSMVGFGSYHYTYASGREGDWFLVGFSPRKAATTIYLMAGVDRHPELLKNLGKHKHAKSCLYIRSLEDVDLKVLRDLVSRSVKYLSRPKP